MRQSLRANRFMMAVFCLTTAACGGSSASSAEPEGTALTVFMPLILEDVAMEYQAHCRPESDDVIVASEGALERTGAFQTSEIEAPTVIFEGHVELVPGPCTIQLRLRDSDGEVIFSATEAYDIEPLPPPELYVVMGDGGCGSQSPLSDASAARKNFCAPGGGLILSAETPAATANIESVHYLLSRTRDGFLETRDGPPVETIEGSLVPAGSGTADLGGGPMETNVWESIVGEVAADGLPYTLELTALDTDGAAVCTAQTTVEVVPTGIAQAHVVMRCAAP